jgi:hypothetical protein
MKLRNEEDPMITVSSLRNPDRAPARRAGRVAASIDVEWTKNYTVKNGNKPFCISVVYAPLPRRSTDLSTVAWEYTSVYLEPGEPETALAARADVLLSAVLDRADLVTGHQVCSDFGVLAATADTGRCAGVDAARLAWRERRSPEQRRRVIDTRYDAGHILSGTSRRLVDVATELGLDVTQPELGTKSMTALHKMWLERGSVEARERISVLNLRHSLSTALVAFRADGLGTWSGRTLNVNRLIAERAAGAWAWLDSPTFRSLLQETP